MIKQFSNNLQHPHIQNQGSTKHANYVAPTEFKQAPSQKSTGRQRAHSNMPPQTVMQARARSVNAYNNFRKNLNKSLNSQIQNNMPAGAPGLGPIQTNQIMNYMANQTMILSPDNLHLPNNHFNTMLQPDAFVNSVPYSATHQQHQQTLQMLKSSIENQGHFQKFIAPTIQTPTAALNLSQQLNSRRHSKHNKTYSLNQNTRRAADQKQMFNMSQSRIGATEQFLNQPLQLNQKILNQTLQYPGQPVQYTSNPNNYATINYAGEQLGSAHRVGYHKNTHSLNLGNMSYLPSSSPKINDPQLQLWQQQQFYQSSSRVFKNMNTISHARSFSNCSKRDLSTKRSGSQFMKNSQLLNNSSNVIQQNQYNQGLNEQQMLESEEYFEQGKIFLSDKKYKESIKAFSKSLQINKNNYDALFYRGVSYLDQGQPQKAIGDLNELVEICPDYRKTIFIVLSIAYRRINDYTGALRTLSKAVTKYPRYIEAYIARGQIYIFQKKWDKSLTDFRTVIQLQADNGLGFLGQGDSLKGIGNYNGALQSYSKAIEVDEQCLQQGLMKRGILYLQMKYSEKALDDFNKLCELTEQQNPQNLQSVAKAYFYKAKTMKKLSNNNDAILHFEQVLKLSEDQFLQSSALYEIAKIKIQQKDFYEAYYNLQRATHFKLKQKKLMNYKMFTEGVIFLMKRKTKTGVKLLTNLLEKIGQIQSNGSAQTANQTLVVAGQSSDYITPLIYIYRAYGYFILDEYDKALKDYIKSNQMKKLNNMAYYNMIMSQGLKCLEQKEYENAISFFTKASQKIPGNRDPYFLRSVAIVRYAMHKPIKPQTKNKMLRDAKRDLNRALKHSPKDYQVMYFRGVLNFALHYFYDAITDFETVIEKSEDTNAKFYLARGRCYACLSMFKEAITDLSIAINLNKDLLDAYLNRGKCAYLIGDTGLAFMDFQKLIVLEPKNPMVHIYAGNLLMTTGSYEDATKAFTNADNIHKSPLALYQRSRCHVALNNMNEALKDLNKVIEISPNDKVAIADKECLSALKIASTNGQPNAPPHDKGVYEKAIVLLTKLISYEKNEHLAKINHDSSILHQHSQVIPSAIRTKTDKIRAIRRRKEQDKQVAKEGESLRRNDLRFRVQPQPGMDDDMEEYEDLSDLDEQELERLNRQNDETQSIITTESKIDDAKQDEEANYYKENIFNKEDYYLYRAVLNFYAGEYDKSISDLEQSSNIMHANKVLYPKNQFPDEDSGGHLPDGDNISQESSQTDLSDVGLCSLNIHEYSYNTVLSLLQLKDYKKALTKLDYMVDTIPKKYAAQIWLLRGILNQIVGHQHIAKKDFKRAYKYDNENAVKFLDQKQNLYLNIFPQQQRLCNFFAYVKFQFPAGQYTQCIYMKPSFSFPFIKPPNMIPCVDNSVLDQFTAKAIPLKPEAPWIKRCSFGIKFTEEIYFTDDDREATPDEEKEYKKRKQQAQERVRDATYVRSLSERVVLRNKIFMKEDESAAREDFENMDQIEEGTGQIDHGRRADMIGVGPMNTQEDNDYGDEYDGEGSDQYELTQTKFNDMSRIEGSAAKAGRGFDNSFLAEINKIMK